MTLSIDLVKSRTNHNRFICIQRLRAKCVYRIEVICFLQEMGMCVFKRISDFFHRFLGTGLHEIFFLDIVEPKDAIGNAEENGSLYEPPVFDMNIMAVSLKYGIGDLAKSHTDRLIPQMFHKVNRQHCRFTLWSFCCRLLFRGIIRTIFLLIAVRS